MAESKRDNPDWEEWRTCKRKTAYDAPLNLPVWRDYFCPFCGKWHVTSNTKKKWRNEPTGWIGA